MSTFPIKQRAAAASTLELADAPGRGGAGNQPTNRARSPDMPA